MSEHITLSHGNGGRLMRELIEEIIAPGLSDVIVDTQNDAVAVTLSEATDQVVMSTDGFTVKPLEFPGGNIGSLAVHGTVNDLAVSGATPLYLSLNMFIEEGLEVVTLKRILASMQQAALDAGVRIVCGDTKVVPKGEGSELYLATTGVGKRTTKRTLGFDQIQPGDAILVSGPVGDHGIAVMFAREQFGLRGDLQSDAASVLPLTRAIQDMEGIRFMRDPTRGGLATVLNEIHQSTRLGVRVAMPDIPVRDSVTIVCEMLGYDPLYLACEGRVVAVVEKESAKKALMAWQSLPQGEQAALIGHVTDRENQYVVITTELGGERILEELEDDPLPRIC
jgi:hydrogenase expression/formation protein HypE